MKCDKCRSEDTKRLQVVYESGTTSIDVVGLSIDGDATSTFGLSQSLLAEKAAPPSKKIPLFSGFFAVVSPLFLLTGYTPIYPYCLAIFAVSVCIVVASLAYNSSKWPDLYKEWQDKWLCLKCGHVYHQD